MKSTLLTPQLTLNWITRVLFFMSSAALLPVLPNYLISIGSNKSQVGIVMSAFAVGVLLFRPLVGKKIDSAGRKVVLVVGVVIFAVAPIFYIFVHSIIPLVALRVFHGLGLAAFGTASITLITDAASPKQRGEIISYTGMVNTIAFSAGPILGSLIGDCWGYSVVFIFVGVASFACLIFSLFIKETKTHDASKASAGFVRAIWQRRIVAAFVIILLIAMIHGAVMFYYPIFLKENLHVNVGLFFAVFGVSTLVVRLFIGRLSDRVGRGPLIVFSLAFIALGVFALNHSLNIGLMFLAAILYGFGFGSQQPTLTTVVADNTTPETRGKIFSFYYGGFDLGISVAGIVLGAVAEYFGIPFMFVVCGILAIGALLIFILLFEHTVADSVRCAFALRYPAKECYICDQFLEVTPEHAEGYFKSEER
jgi:MFS family permease